MNYITTNRYKSVALCGKELNIPYGEAIDERGGVLYWHNQAVCAVESDNGFRHFSWNGDERGKERGARTYKYLDCTQHTCGVCGKDCTTCEALIAPRKRD